MIPIPDASIPDSDIVTAEPTITLPESDVPKHVEIPVENTSPSELIVTPDPTLTVDTVVTPA